MKGTIDKIVPFVIVPFINIARYNCKYNKNLRFCKNYCKIIKLFIFEIVKTESPTFWPGFHYVESEMTVLLSICEHGVVLHDAVDAGTNLCYYSLILGSVQNLLNEFGNDNHQILLCTTGSDCGSTKTQT